VLQLQVRGTIEGTITLDDAELAKLAGAIAAANGGPAETDRQRLTGETAERSMDVEFPEHWELVETRDGETYTWPEGPDEYTEFNIYEGRTPRGVIRLAIGRCERTRVWGRDRVYMITFHITAGGKRPLCEFLEVDDHATSREFIAIIRGNGDSGRGMYSPSAPLPGAYRKLRIEIYSDRIRSKGAWTKQAVVAQDGDIDSMLNHSLIQADQRFEIRPA
jgi:hypothetical protein